PLRSTLIPYTTLFRSCGPYQRPHAPIAIRVVASCFTLELSARQLHRNVRMQIRTSAWSGASGILQNVEQFPQVAPTRRHTVTHEKTNCCERDCENRTHAEPTAAGGRNEQNPDHCDDR